MLYSIDKEFDVIMIIEKIKQFLIKRAKRLKGLSNDEIKKIEQIYNLKFPKVYKNYLKEGIILFECSIMWNDFSKENIKYIKERIKIINEINVYNFCLEKNPYNWPSTWGDCPKDMVKAYEYIKKRYKKAPKLIPVSIDNCAIAEGYDEDDSPVFHVIGEDSIVWHKNLNDFINSKILGLKKNEVINFNDIPYIDFWSDISF
ncbi:SMI1/KNR4 family protein [Oceanivirga salmonicida]|uniref:SMI1/KNR4 family protein n=1 Tax=Oceanivirga salmonicida TaxID=1769291 RepID=UPI00083674A8|nr:SMI1/KNR4 family protein [Oceanivirga salmonicida]